MIVTICYFLKLIKSVFILVQCNTSPSENYVARSYVTVVCVIGWIWGKNGLSALSGCLCIWNQSLNKDFSTNSHSTTKRLKHSSNFESGENVWSSNVIEFEFELRHIPNMYSSNASKYHSYHTLVNGRCYKVHTPLSCLRYKYGMYGISKTIPLSSQRVVHFVHYLCLSGCPPPTVWAQVKGQVNALRLCKALQFSQKLYSSLSLSEMQFRSEKGHFVFFSPPPFRRRYQPHCSSSVNIR